MSADYAIDIQADQNLIDVRMSGFFSIEDVARYHAAMAAASRALGGDPGQQKLICDITQMRIQAQDIVDAFRANMADPLYARRRIAFVVTPTLARMQVQRAMGSRTARLFHTRAEAEAWLFAGDRAAA